MSRRYTKKGTVKTWMEAHVSFDGDECLIFPFSRNRYGRGWFKLNGQRMEAHRAMCIMAYGKPPKPELVAAHVVCDNGRNGCVNPRHLSWQTAEQNAEDRKKFGRNVWGQRSGRSKLTDLEASLMIARIKSGDKQSEIASDLGVDPSLVSHVANGRLWRQLW